MSDHDQRLTDAEVRVTAARERLNASAGRLRQRLDPKRLARNAVRDVAEAGTTAVENGAIVAKRNPATLAAIGAAIALVLARRPIERAIRRISVH